MARLIVLNCTWPCVYNCVTGGGYSYRLCSKGESGGSLLEDCFQRGHLNFADLSQSWIQYGGDETNRTAITSVTLSEGTHPKNSQWKRNPIPACAGCAGGVGTPDCPAPQFPPPLPGLYGYGSAACFQGSAGAGGNCTRAQREYWKEKFDFNIIDRVEVPVTLPVGEYALSFRWDAEQVSAT